MRTPFKWTTVLACLLGTAFSGSFAQDQEVRVGVASWMLEKMPMEEAATKFEENHPGVDIVLESLASEFDTSIIPALSAENPPYDLLMPYSGGDAAPFAELDLLAPWNNVFDNPDFQVNGHELGRSDFVEGFIQQADYDGQTISLPVFGEIMALTVRKDLLNDAGVSDVPATWSEVTDACVKLANPFMAGFSSEISRGRNTITALFGIAMANGGSILDEEGRFNLLAPETVEAMNYLVGLNTEQECAQSNAVDQWDASRTAFLGGHVATFYNWASWGMQAVLPEPIFGEDAISTSAAPGASENGTVLYTGGAIIPKNGNVELAQLFVVEMIESLWFQQWSASRYGKSPVLTENYEGLSDAQWGHLIPMTTNGESMPSFLNFTEMTNIFQKHFNRAWNGEITPEAALAATEEEIAPLYQN